MIPLGNLLFVVYLSGKLDLLGVGGGSETGALAESMRGQSGLPAAERTATDGGYAGSTTVSEQLAAYDSVARVRALVDRPVRTLLARPTALLYVTVPVAVLSVALRAPAAFEGGLQVRALDDVLIQALLFVVATFAVVWELHSRRIRQMEAALPELLETFQAQACFTLDGASQALEKPRGTVLDEIKYLMKQDYVYSVRRELYAFNAERTGRLPDRYVVASKVTEPYAFGYHSALELHGVAQSAIYTEVYLATPSRFSPFEYEGVHVRPVESDPELLDLGAIKIKRSGTKLKVASRELALVQCADRLKYAGGLEEVLLSVEGFPYLRWDALEELLSHIGKKVLYRKVGFILAYHAQRWDPPQDLLDRFADRITRVEVHLSDVNAQKGGQDIRCVVEARAAGLDPVAVDDTAEDVERAVRGAAGKLQRALDSRLGKRGRR
jgi:predicted transcriptional regulator of viral defense system